MRKTRESTKTTEHLNHIMPLTVEQGDVEAQLGPNLGGRPPKAITDEQVYKLGLIHCTPEEAAYVLGCSLALIHDKFMDVLQKGHKYGQKSMKRKMHEIAMNGNVTMLIWLSKQRLGYKERAPEDAQIVNYNVTINEVPK